MTSDTTGIASEVEQAQKRVSFDLVGQIVKLLEPLTAEERRHILQTVLTWLHIEDVPLRGQQPTESSSDTPSPPKTADEYPFSGRSEISPKEFILEKEPQTDLERLTCLAYYLTHYRDQRYFKTEDLSKLNTEAAQRRFSNAAFTALNAVRDGFFVQAPKPGLRQLSAIGEQYVQALPNHEAATEVRKRMRARGRRPRGKTDKSGPTTETSNTRQ
jgi:hypothetical protein